MSKKRKSKGIKWRVGAVVRIDLGGGPFAFGRLLESPLIAIYDLKHRGIPEIDEVISAPIAFKVWVMKYAINDGDWPIIANVPLDARLLEQPWFYKQDPINGRLTLYKGGGGPELPASLEECEGLECAAVWEPEHIVDRLNDHFEGRPNKWVESLRPHVPRGAK